MAVNLEQRLAMLASGEQIGIMKLFEVDGEETDDDEFAFSFVAGPDGGGFWYVGVLEEFGDEALN